MQLLTTDNTVVGVMTQTFIQAVNQRKGPLSYSDILEYMHNSIQEANKSITRGLRRLFYRKMLQVLNNSLKNWYYLNGNKLSLKH